MTKDSIIVTYRNSTHPEPKTDIWSFRNMSNIWLGRDRRSWTHLNLKRRKVSDIIKNDKPEEVYIKQLLLEKLNYM